MMLHHRIRSDTDPEDRRHWSDPNILIDLKNGQYDVGDARDDKDRICTYDYVADMHLDRHHASPAIFFQKFAKCESEKGPQMEIEQKLKRSIVEHALTVCRDMVSRDKQI